MILAGDYIDATLGAAFAISTMAAAGEIAVTNSICRTRTATCKFCHIFSVIFYAAEPEKVHTQESSA